MREQNRKYNFLVKEIKCIFQPCVFPPKKSQKAATQTGNSSLTLHVQNCQNLHYFPQSEKQSFLI